ncbi:FAD-dependent urate hydroxylase HpxO [Microbacterium sediminicola]|uniref:FAD-dependent urate hydroxylase n=1 Tax=Microbacterium sediminicola TaxID=415210 RepID=A0ABP4UHT1_9MICO
MRIIIIGAGIGGTSIGIALKRQGHEVVIYDQMRENKPVGAALSLWSNGIKVLNWLGLTEEVATLGGQLETMAYREGLSGRTMCEFSLEPVTALTGQRSYPVARTDLQALLMETFGLDDIHLNSKMVGIEDDGTTVTASFADGSTDSADLLIGADGARSLTRAYVTTGTEEEGRERSYSGYTNFNGLIPANESIGPKDQWTTYVTEGKRAAVMPVAGDRFYFWFDIPQPDGLPYERGDMTPLREAFGHWAPGVQELLDTIDPDVSLNRVEIWDLDPVQHWVRGRVAILGDAAHNTAPDIGQGACSALEDSFVLATILATTTISVEDSLRRYEKLRAERAGDLVLRARKRGHETHAFDKAATDAWYESLEGADGVGIIRGIVGNIEGSPINLGPL